MSDLIDDLAGIVPGDRLDALRAARPIAKRDAQASYDGLIASPSDLGRATAVERAAIGYWVAALSRSAPLTQHYSTLLAALDGAARDAIATALPAAQTEGPYGRYPAGPLSVEDADGLRWNASPELRAAIGVRLAAALEHAHLLTYRPRDASADALDRLRGAGWTADGVVTISQLVAFTHFQLRLVAGLNALKESN